VKIGEILHPALTEHSITEITFYLDNKFIANVMLTADVIHLKSGAKGKARAIENCNAHGKWFNEVEIK
jgi:superoxide reductase